MTMSDSELVNGVDGIDLDNDDITARHKKERKNLQAQIQALKKTAGKGDKKKKKEVLEEIVRLEADLERKHADELASAAAFVPKRQSDDEDEAPVTDDKSGSIPANQTQTRISKAQKRRDKKAEEERKREAEILIAEKLNKNGPRELESAAIKKVLQSRKLVLHSITSDGDCLYNAIRHQLSITGRQPIDTATLRRLTSEYILANKDSLIFYMSNPNTGDQLTDDEFEKYCLAIRDTKAWGGHIEIKALSEILHAPIEVLQATGPPTIQGEGQFKGAHLVITYHRHMYKLGEHYNSTVHASTVDDSDE